MAIHVPPFGTGSVLRSALNFFVQDYVARIAVPFFFVASGFFLFNKIDMANIDFGRMRHYIVRIIRLYIIWCLVYLPLVIVSGELDRGSFIRTLMVWARNVIFIGGYRQLWYLNALAFAVFLMAVFMRCGLGLKSITAIAAGFYLLGLFAQSWFGFIRPLSNALPVLWRTLKVVERVIVTTRDGLFDGFLFVSIGACFAEYNMRISKKKAVIGFLISMICLLVETVMLNKLKIAREQDMYLCLIPAVSFLFAWMVRTELPDKPIYKSLRGMSSCIFYLHMLIVFMIGRIVGNNLQNSEWFSLLVLIFTIVGSYLLLMLSETRKFRWLNFFYK